jgi:hypothetical protein
MARLNPKVLTLLVVVIVAAGVVAAILYYQSPGQRARRQERRQITAREQRFTAQFDSLCKARLYPAVWRSGTFTKTQFDEGRRHWTLTMSLQDWDRRSEDSKIDLATRLFTNFCGVRAQAGSDPGKAVLTIEDEEGTRLASCSSEKGTLIHR